MIGRDRSKIVLVAIILVGLAARAAVMAPRINQPAEDPDNYLPLARALAEGRGFLIRDNFTHKDRPTAYRPPLYPLILAPLVSGDRFTPSMGGVHLILGAITIGMTSLASTRWGLSRRRVWIAAILVALDPTLVVQSRAVMTETLAAALLVSAVASTASTTRRGAALGGIAFGLAALCRPSTLPAAGLVTVFAMLPGAGSWQTRLGRGFALAATTLLVLLPWGIRNFLVLGEPVLTTTHGGYTLALANNPAYYRDVLNGPPGAVWGGEGQRAWSKAMTKATEGMSEPEADRFLRDEALRLLREQPSNFLRASLARLGRFWGLAPSGVYSPSLRIGSAAWTLPFWVAVALGVMRPESWRWPKSSAIAIIMALTMVHAVYWTDLRMRAPIVPELALLAAMAFLPSWEGVKKKLKKSKKGPSRAVQNERIG